MPYYTDAGDTRLSGGGPIRTCSLFNPGDLLLQAIPLHLNYSVCRPGEPPSGKEVEVTATVLEHLGDQENWCTDFLFFFVLCSLKHVGQGVTIVILNILFTHLWDI